MPRMPQTPLLMSAISKINVNYQTIEVECRKQRDSTVYLKSQRRTIRVGQTNPLLITTVNLVVTKWETIINSKLSELLMEHMLANMISLTQRFISVQFTEATG